MLTRFSAKSLHAAACTLLMTLLLPNGATAALIKEGFETGDYEGTGWRVSGNKPEIVGAPAPICRGKRVLRISLHRNRDPVSFRTELALAGNEAGPLKNLKQGEDYWLGMSIFLPVNWEPDPKSIDILAQLHGVPDKDQGEVYRNPMLAFYIRGDEWALSTKRDSRRVTATDQSNMEYEEYGFRSLGKIETGRWVRFVFQFRLSYMAGEGHINVWKNGKKIVDNYQGGVGFNDRTGPYWKIGNYKPAWKPGREPTAVTHRLHYVDEVAVASGANRYDDVAPVCGTSRLPSPQPESEGEEAQPQEPPLPAPPTEPVETPEAEERASTENKPMTPVIKNVIIKDPAPPSR